MGQGDETFALDMGTPVTRSCHGTGPYCLPGSEPDFKHKKIKFIGLRVTGEKLDEDPITADRKRQPTQHAKILMLKGNCLEINN